MGNRYLQEVTGIIRKQQGKRGPVMYTAMIVYDTEG